MKKRKLRRPPAGPPNLAAKALGNKIFGLKVVAPRKGYTRKIKHKGSTPDASLPSFVSDDESEGRRHQQGREFIPGSSPPA